MVEVSYGFNMMQPRQKEELWEGADKIGSDDEGDVADDMTTSRSLIKRMCSVIIER
jgi:hypothetical protein